MHTAGYSRKLSYGAEKPAKSTIAWTQVFAPPGSGRYVSMYAFQLLLPVAGKALAGLAGHPPNKDKNLDAVLDGVFRYVVKYARQMTSYGGEPDRVDAAAQVAIGMARQLGWTKQAADAAVGRLLLVWYPQQSR